MRYQCGVRYVQLLLSGKYRAYNGVSPQEFMDLEMAISYAKS